MPKILKRCPFVGDGSTGPVSTLTGTLFQPDTPSSICERQHDVEVLAVYKMQTETDSLGCEYTHLCESCYQEILTHVDIGDCEWCSAKNVKTKPTKHWEEGSGGGEYDVCEPCRDKYYTEVNEMCKGDSHDYHIDYDEDEPYPDYEDESEALNLPKVNL